MITCPFTDRGLVMLNPASKATPNCPAVMTKPATGSKSMMRFRPVKISSTSPFSSAVSQMAPVMPGVSYFVGSSRFVSVAVSPGEVKSVLPPGKAIVFALPPNSTTPKQVKVETEGDEDAPRRKNARPSPT